MEKVINENSIYMANGIHFEDFEKLWAVKNQNVMKSYGLHPWFLNELEDDWESWLKEFWVKELKEEGKLHIGEIGLDKCKEKRVERDK